MLNEDYKDMLSSLDAEKVEYLLVGAYALALHGHVRATMDIDIWVKPSGDNALAVLRALRRFGAPAHGLTLDDLRRDDTVFQIGVAPRRIDIITGATGLRFDETFARSVEAEVEGLRVHIPAVEDLIRNKRASGRPKDLVDAESLESLAGRQGADGELR